MGLNRAKVVFETPTNGIVTKMGWAHSIAMADIVDTFGEKRITSGSYTDSPQNFYFEKHSKALILRPDIRLRSILNPSGTTYTTTNQHAITLATLANWEFHRAVGEPALDMLFHHSVMEAWSLETGYVLDENQGAIFYWREYRKAEDIPRELTFSILDAGAGNNAVEILFNSESDDETEAGYVLVTKYTALTGTDTPPTITVHREEWKIALPEMKKTNDWDLQSLIVLFVGQYIILGLNGLEQTVACKAQKFNLGTDARGKQYPILSPAKSQIKIESAGCVDIGFDTLLFTESAEYVSQWYKPPALTINAPKAEIVCGYMPTGTNIGHPSMAAFNGQIIDVEANASATESGRIRYGFQLQANATKTITPWLWALQIGDDPVRETASCTPVTIAGNVMAFNRKIYAKPDGEFGMDACEIQINNISSPYQNLLTWRNAQMTISLDAGSLSAYFTEAVHLAEEQTVEIESPNNQILTIPTLSIIKRLQKYPVMIPKSFDHLNYRHGDMMIYFATTLCGVPLWNADGSAFSFANYSDDPTLPNSEDATRPNWQWNPGAKVWDCMEQIRKYSSWALFPRATGGLFYFPMPTADSSPNYTIDLTKVAKPKFTFTDSAKTRFLVAGQAGSDGNIAHNSYRAGQKIMAYMVDEATELSVGETRPLWVYDTSLSTPEMVNAFCQALFKWYTKFHKTLQFDIDDVALEDTLGVKYYLMRLFHVLSVTHPVFTSVNGKYLVLSLTKVWGPAMRKCTVMAVSL